MTVHLSMPPSPCFLGLILHASVPIHSVAGGSREHIGRTTCCVTYLLGTARDNALKTPTSNDVGGPRDAVKWMDSSTYRWLPVQGEKEDLAKD